MVALRAMLEETILVATYAQQALAESAGRHREDENAASVPEITHHRMIYKDFDVCDRYDKASRFLRDQAVESRPKFKRRVAVIPHGYRWELLSDPARKANTDSRRWKISK